MKNLRKTVCIAIALVLVFVVSGCGTGSNYPGTNNNTGNRALGTGNAYNMGTNALTNIGMNLGTNPGTNFGMNNWMNPGSRTGTNVTANPRTGTNYNYGTGMNYGYGTGMNYGTGMFPGTTGTNVGTTRYRDGVYTASCDRRPNGADLATVTVRNGRIQNVAFKRIDGNGRDVNYSTITGMAGRTANNSLNELARKIVAAQGVNVSPMGSSMGTGTSTGTNTGTNTGNNTAGTRTRSNTGYNTGSNTGTNTGTNTDINGFSTACRRALDKARI